MRVEKGRKSAKGTVASYAEELLNRSSDPESQTKLMALQTIALRMGWTELYNKLRFREHGHQSDPNEKWWNR